MLFSNSVHIGNFQSPFHWAFWLHWTLLITSSFSKCSALRLPWYLLLWSLCFLSVFVMGSWLSFTSIWCSCMSVLYFLTVSFCMFLSMISFTLMVSSILKCYQTHIPCVVLLCLSSRSVCSTALWISLFGPLPGFWCFLPFQYHLFQWADLPFIPSDPNKKPGS